MKSIVQEYMYQLEKHLQCPRSIRGPFLQQIEKELDAFCTRNADADAELLTQTFGSPEDIAREFLSELGTETVASCIRSRRRTLIIAISVMVLALGAVRFLVPRISLGNPPAAENQFVASVKYAQEDMGQEEQVSADVFISTGAPAQPLDNASAPWYNNILYGGGGSNHPLK